MNQVNQIVGGFLMGIGVFLAALLVRALGMQVLS